MSLLLDALKQAAQKKKLKDNLLAEQLLDKEQHPDGNITPQKTDKSGVAGESDAIVDDSGNDNGDDEQADIHLILDEEILDEQPVNKQARSDEPFNKKSTDKQPLSDKFDEQAKEQREPDYDPQQVDKESTTNKTVEESAEKIPEQVQDQAVVSHAKPPVTELSLEIEPEEKDPVSEQALKVPPTNTPSEVQESEEKRKQAIKKLTALKKSEAKRRVTHMAAVATAVMVVAMICLFAYYHYTNSELEKNLAAKESFDDFVKDIVNQEANATLLQSNNLNEESAIDNKQGSSEPIGVNQQPNRLDAASGESITDNQAFDETQSVEQGIAGQPDDELGENEVRDSANETEKEIDALVEELALGSELTAVNTTQTTKANVDEFETAKSGNIKSLEIDGVDNLVRPGKKTINKSQQLVQQAYRAYQNGNLQVARNLYDQALIQQPEKRDAILGAAAVAIRQGRQPDALSLYQQLLSLSPQDSYAHAGLLSLQTANIKDPRWSSQVKQLLLRYPDAAHLHFLKANADAANGRWQAAQKSYFDAWTLDKVNPDYVYNLAISLDQLGKPQVALNYYRQAMALHLSHPSNIVVKDLQRRIAQLEIVQGGR